MQKYCIQDFKETYLYILDVCKNCLSEAILTNTYNMFYGEM